MERKLNAIDRKEILYYLNCPSESIDPVLSAFLEEGIEAILKLAKPRLHYKVYPFQNKQLRDSSLFLQGNDIQTLLASSTKVILVAATLGSSIDQLLRKTQIQDMGKALVFDQCANAAIEQVIQDWQDEVVQKASEQGWYFSDRFSPGYGDLPIQLQKDFIMELDASRKLGLHVSNSNLLLPCKSITAIIGLSQQVQPAILRGCEVCALKDTCQKRKEGNPCGKK